jgi:murein L,D-transpeptidase YafK
MTAKLPLLTVIPMMIVLLLFSGLVVALPKADFVLVKKSERKLYLLHEGKPFKEYHVALGDQPRGHKQREGDERTPEGRYQLDFKNENSDYYKSIRISYPSRIDRLAAKSAGYSPGGAIMIHGMPGRELEVSPRIMQIFNWTDGCIAVTNEEMEEIWLSVDVGTPIEILP